MPASSGFFACPAWEDFWIWAEAEGDTDVTQPSPGASQAGPASRGREAPGKVANSRGCEKHLALLGPLPVALVCRSTQQGTQGHGHGHSLGEECGLAQPQPHPLPCPNPRQRDKEEVWGLGRHRGRPSMLGFPRSAGPTGQGFPWEGWGGGWSHLQGRQRWGWGGALGPQKGGDRHQQGIFWITNGMGRGVLRQGCLRGHEGDRHC